MNKEKSTPNKRIWNANETIRIVVACGDSGGAKSISVVFYPVETSWVAFIPSTQWHLDPIHTQVVAQNAAERVGGVVYPTLFWGTEREREPQFLTYMSLDSDLYVVGMDHPKNTMKSLYTREEVFALVLRETRDSLRSL